MKDGCGFASNEIISFLEGKKIENRKFFAGNILRQPGYIDIENEIRGKLTNTDKTLNDTFFVGVYPGITKEKMDFMLQSFDEFFQSH